MRVHSSVRAVSILIAFALLTPLVSAQEKVKDEARYKFKKGEVLKYEVTSSLDASMAGTHPDHLTGGNDNPLTWTVNGTFENVVLDVGENGTAILERRVRSIDSHGHVQNAAGLERFKYSWNRDKEKGPPDESKIESLMDRYIANMVAKPVKFSVSPEGEYNVDMEDMKRLVMRRGMMYWPVKANEVSWTSVEEIALPILHDKLKIEFKNTVTGDAGGSGARIRKINAPATLKEKNNSGFHQWELSVTVSGSAKPEFDLTNGRLNRLDLTITARFTGKGPLAGGGDGDVKGVATYRESQVYKD
jgi:hypothetical protein